MPLISVCLCFCDGLYNVVCMYPYVCCVFVFLCIYLCVWARVSVCMCMCLCTWQAGGLRGWPYPPEQAWQGYPWHARVTSFGGRESNICIREAQNKRGVYSAHLPPFHSSLPPAHTAAFMHTHTLHINAGRTLGGTHSPFTTPSWPTSSHTSRPFLPALSSSEGVNVL